jgi:hypothetical protein
MPKKIIFTKSPSFEPHNLAYDVGDTVELKNADADALIEAGIAVEPETEEAKKKED